MWQINTYQRRQEHEKGLRANYHYRIHLQRICFNAWLTYADYRRKKNLHKSRKILLYFFWNIFIEFYQNVYMSIIKNVYLEEFITIGNKH
jgi:hypothetical protein